MNATTFARQLKATHSEHCFNPYSDVCAEHDRADAAQIRFSLLLAVLKTAAATGVDSLWIGRDLGYRGGRRTGLALTDDKHLASHAARWDVPCFSATRGEPIGERTATIMWSVLAELTQPIFLWNVFPLHPHEPGNPLSNRQHNAREREMGLEILDAVVALLRPRSLVAFGNDAAQAVERLGMSIRCEGVRHPSYGGQSQCVASLKRIYALNG